MAADAFFLSNALSRFGDIYDTICLYAHLIQHLLVWFLSLHSKFGTDVFTDFFVEILNYSTFVV